MTMSEVIEGWLGAMQNLLSQSAGLEDSVIQTCAIKAATFEECADEASVVLAAQRAKVAEWRAKAEKLYAEDEEGDERTAMANVYAECADALEAILGPLEGQK